MIPSTKEAVFNYFDQQIPIKAIQQFDGQWEVVGKFCRIAIEENGIDLWLCNPRDMTKALSPKKLTYLLQALKTHSTADIRVLTGEADTKGFSKEEILGCLPVLGIPKKKVISEAHKKKMMLGLKAKNKKALEFETKAFTSSTNLTGQEKSVGEF